jgi:hypothetical protein
MGLTSHAVAAGIGYTLARPDGRRQLNRLRQPSPLERPVPPVPPADGP